MIDNLLSTSTIKLQKDVDNWQDAGREAGRLLLENNLIDEDYIERMIEGVYEFGPYIVIGPGIALFHARPESSVKEICLSMVTLKEPVEFGAGDKDPVDLVFALGALDHDTHLNLMAELMVILQDNELLNNIRQEENAENVLEMIDNKLEKENE